MVVNRSRLAECLLCIMILVGFMRLSIGLYGRAVHTTSVLSQRIQELQREIGDLEGRLSSEQDALEALRSQLGQVNDELFVAQQELSILSRRVIYIPASKTAYLTFDDGPSLNTIEILDILKHYGIKATFFVVGNTSPFASRVYQRIIAEGHALGNHTFSHNYSRIYSSIEAYLEDHYQLEELLFSITGQRPRIMRFPGGSNNRVSEQYSDPGFMERLTQYMVEEGYYYYDWNVSSLDATATTVPRDLIIEAVLSRVSGKPTPIILFHDSSSKTTTVEALPYIIEALMAMGYRFEVLAPGAFMVQFI